MYKDIYPGCKILDASVDDDIYLVLSSELPGGAPTTSTVKIFDTREHNSLVRAAVQLWQHRWRGELAVIRSIWY
jgi:hypothetical protein